MTKPPLMEIRGLSKRFGGIVAVLDLSFDVQPGEILALIGPNGAGKTTTFNLVAGLLSPDAGTVGLLGQRLDELPVHEVAGRGLARTFQHNMPFAGMSLTDNVLVGAHSRFRATIADLLIGRSFARTEEARERARAQDIIDFVGLGNRLDQDVTTLSFGEGRLLEVARALAAEPKVILLDEPAAGLTPAEMRRLSEVVRAIAARGVSVLLIEHDMHFLLPLADRVVVLNFGRKIAEGTPAQIMAHPDVIAAYLGEAGAKGRKAHA